MSKRKKRKQTPFSANCELDLHGFTLFEAEMEIESFLYECKKKSHITLVRIITGKGIHSPLGRKTLFEFVEEYLTQRNIPFEKEDQGSFLIFI